jgi:hypothetical protein
MFNEWTRVTGEYDKGDRLYGQEYTSGEQKVKRISIKGLGGR